MTDAAPRPHTPRPVAASVLPGPWLVADIGGTNARFGWLETAGSPIEHVVRMPAADHAGPVAAARAYLAQIAPLLGDRWRAPRAGAFAVATAIDGDRIAFTNSNWAFSRNEAQSGLGLDELLILNDFEALALSLPRLGPDQVMPFGPVALTPAGAEPRRALAVIGPGTGLGVAGLVPAPHGWIAVAGEGGHATLAPTDDFERSVLVAVQRDHAHVSAERLLSGIGLPVLHAAVGDVMGHPAAMLTAREIVERGLDGGDAVCSRTIDSFCELLGSFAGSVALVLGARGGVYIGGGIVPRLGQRFFDSRFRERFEAKGRFQAYLQAIPTALITDTLAALSGAALALEQHR